MSRLGCPEAYLLPSSGSGSLNGSDGLGLGGSLNGSGSLIHYAYAPSFDFDIDKPLLLQSASPERHPGAEAIISVNLDQRKHLCPAPTRSRPFHLECQRIATRRGGHPKGLRAGIRLNGKLSLLGSALISLRREQTRRVTHSRGTRCRCDRSGTNDATQVVMSMVCAAKDTPPPKSEERTPASPDEGAELIRAFLQIERKSVRDAIIELVKRLSQANLPTERP